MNICTDLDVRTKRFLGRTTLAPYSHALLQQTLSGAGSWPEFLEQMANLLNRDPPRQVARIGKALSRLFAIGFCDAFAAWSQSDDGLPCTDPLSINSRWLSFAQQEVRNEYRKIAFTVAGLARLYQLQSGTVTTCRRIQLTGQYRH